MEEWIKQIINGESITAAVIPAAFLLGLVGAFSSCCNYAVIGMIAGYSGSLSAGERKRSVIWSGIAFFIGNIVALALIGAAMGFVSTLLVNALSGYWKIIAGLVSIIFGLVTMNILPFKLPKLSLSPKNESKGIVPALVFGLVVGGVTTACNACCNPLFPVVLGGAFLKGGTLWGSIILLCFAIGYSLPLAAAMIGLGFGFGKLSASVAKFNLVIKYVAGGILILVGFYFLISG